MQSKFVAAFVLAGLGVTVFACSSKSSGGSTSSASTVSCTATGPQLGNNVCPNDTQSSTSITMNECNTCKSQIQAYASCVVAANPKAGTCGSDGKSVSPTDADTAKCMTQYTAEATCILALRDGGTTTTDDAGTNTDTDSGSTTDEDAGDMTQDDAGM